MIRNTLARTRSATFSVQLPNKQNHDMPTPTGTGFFVSTDGWFITAAHVITEDGNPEGNIRGDIDSCWLMKERSNGMCQYVTVGHVLPEYDLALLKVDFDKNSNKEWLKGQTGFPFVEVSARPLEMGGPVYSFGYPLSSATTQKVGESIVGNMSLSPRVTSAIISSDLDITEMVMIGGPPKHYVLDKALNYGNSGGPIMSSETGHVHAICSRFQPVYVPQQHLADVQGRFPSVMIPSLYGVVSNLGSNGVIKLLKSLGVPVFE
jgi:serine protease Do